MQNIFLAILIFMTTVVVAQQIETADYKAVAAKFEKYYNNGSADSLFAMLSPETQKALPLDKLSSVTTALHMQMGKIVQRDFLKYEGPAIVYKTKLERGLLTLTLAIDSNSKLTGLLFKPYAEPNLPKMERNTTKLKLPFKEEWTVFWGGDTKELNYHVSHPAQKNAFDILIFDANGKSFKTNGKTNEDYYAFGKELVAPCDGEVMLVVDGVKDNVPGELNPVYVPGNTVIIKTANNEYLFFAHFKQHSIKVKQGQKVKQGELLGLCGNSGNSSEPHLHFHIQNAENMNVATGVKCYFDQVVVNGQVKSDYSPIKGEKIKRE
ncbi:MAG TPA: peptidoglycan DD-metalloendopeptidase family protein [Cyclobacteriaceae bacterium]